MDDDSYDNAGIVSQEDSKGSALIMIAVAVIVAVGCVIAWRKVKKS